MVQLLVSHEFESGLKQTSKQFGSHVNFNMCKPGPPRFAWSSGTILVISSSHLLKIDLKKVHTEAIITQYACANDSTTTLLVINSVQSIQYRTH